MKALPTPAAPETFPDDFNYRGHHYEVRFVVDHEHTNQDRFALCYSAAGEFFAIKYKSAGDNPNEFGARLVRVFTAREAALWFAKCVALDAPFAAALAAAVTQGEFAFVPRLALRAKPKRKRKPKAAPPVGAVQMELATALVAVLRDLAAAPSVETLSEARRRASALHQSLHAEETFRQVSIA